MHIRLVCLILALLGICGGAKGADYLNWMNDHWNTIKGKTLRQLVIPGSHDSGAYDLVNEWEFFDPRFYDTLTDFAGPDTAEKAAKYLHAGPFFEVWSQTQARTIYEQLQDGIRALDLRVAVAPGGGFRIVHSLYGDTIDIVLDDIKRFSTEHPGEILHVRFDHFHDIGLRTATDYTGGLDKMRLSKHEELRDLITSKIGDRLILNWTPTSTLESLRAAGSARRILLFYNERTGIPARSGFISDSNYASNNDWVGSTKSNETPASFKALTLGKINGFQTGTQLHRLGAVTPTDDQYDAWYQGGSFGGLGGNNPKSLQAYAEDTNPVLAKWINEEWAGKKLNIIHMDFYPDYLVPLCLKLNGVTGVSVNIPEDNDWGNYKTLATLFNEAAEKVEVWGDTAVADVSAWFEGAYQDVEAFFNSLSSDIESLFTQRFEVAFPGVPPIGGVPAGVRHYVISVKRIEVLAAPADWEGDLEIYGQILMVPSAYAYTDLVANKTLWSLPEGNAGRTKIGQSLEIDAAKNLYVKESESAGMQVSLGGVLFDNEEYIFAGLGDHLLELDSRLRSGPLTFDLAQMSEGEKTALQRVEYVKPDVARVAVYFEAERKFAPVIPQAPGLQWAANSLPVVTVDRLNTMGTGLLQAFSGVAGRIQYQPPLGTFLPPGSILDVQARFIPNDTRRFTEQVITRKVIIPEVVRPLPGRVEAENYDAFRGSIFTETTTDAGGGVNVRSTQAGQETSYKILAGAAFQYIPKLRVATTTAGQRLQVFVDGKILGSEITVPNTGGWQNWQTITLPVISLTSGFHNVAVVWVTGGVNLNYFSFDFPGTDEYVQNFNTFADGATAFGDGSLLTSTHLGTATRAQGGVLRLTSNGTLDTLATFRLPPLSQAGLPTTSGFEASFRYHLSWNNDATFRYGPLSINFGGLLRADVRVNGVPVPGADALEVSQPIGGYHTLVIRWSKQSGTGRLTILADDQIWVSNVVTPGFNPTVADEMSFTADSGTAADFFRTTTLIDDVRIRKLPPETRILRLVGSTDLGAVEPIDTFVNGKFTHGVHFNFELVNDGNAPLNVRSITGGPGLTMEFSSALILPGATNGFGAFQEIRGNGDFQIPLLLNTDSTAGTAANGNLAPTFHALVPGRPSGAKLRAFFPLDTDGNSSDGALIASDVRDVTFGGEGALPGSAGSAKFNGTSSRIQHAWKALLNPGTASESGSFTVTAWARMDGPGDYQSVITSRHDNAPDSSGYILYDTPGGVWEFWSGNGVIAENWDILGGPTHTVGQWQHLALVYDAISRRKTLFVNGEPTLHQSAFVGANRTQPFNIGAGGDLGDSFFFKGSIDDVAVFDGPLERSEIAKVMAGNLDSFVAPVTRSIATVGNLDFGALEAIDGRIVGHFQITNSGNARLTILAFGLPSGVTLNWTGGFLESGEARDLVVQRAASEAGPVNWQIAALSDATTGADEYGQTFFTLRATVVQPPKFIVMNGNDFGLGSLREALNAAAAHPGSDTITFDPEFNGLVNLASEIVIADAAGVTIDAITMPHGVRLTAAPGSRIFKINSGATAVFRRLQITGGAVSGSFPDSYGGGLFIEGNATLIGCRISENSAFAGGAAFVTGSGSLTLHRSTVDGNLAEHGGGIQNEGALMGVSSTWSGNIATADGGAISSPFDSPLNLTNCTIAANSAAGAGGGVKGNVLKIENTIIAGNTADTGANFTGALQATGANITSGDPRLGALSDNGGPTPTMALLRESPARNAAVNSSVSMDQRGLPLFGIADLGAFEAQAGEPAEMHIEQFGANLMISWIGGGGYILERTAALTPDAIWTSVPFTMAGDTASAPLGLVTSGNAYFRLRRP